MPRNTQPPEGEQPVHDAPASPGAPTEQPAELGELTVSELEAEAARRGVTVGEGSGADGSVVKADLVDAIADVPEPPAGRPPLILLAQAAAAHITPTPVED